MICCPNRWMNGQHLRALPPEELLKIFGDRWKCTGILLESEGIFIKVNLDWPSLSSHTIDSEECKPIVQDKLSEVAASLISAYDGGELPAALEEGHAGWQKWVKGFGKLLKRKVSSLTMAYHPLWYILYHVGMVWYILYRRDRYTGTDRPTNVLHFCQGKSLFMPLRVLLTGKLHGPDMGGSILLIYKAGLWGVVNPEAGFITLDERFKMLREVDWEALDKENKQLESVAGRSD
ncbi:hypothetical protein GW17_00042510 [Ensete ventricosum]|nr:hypothetical protein GW17_00042510 [Ensete ventricosum]